MRFKPIKSVDYLVVHASASQAKSDIGVKEIDAMHRKRGFIGGVGYHYVIRRDGTIEKGRPDNKPGAHARGYNHLSLGICLIGGVKQVRDPVTKKLTLEPEDNFTDKQKLALYDLLSRLSAEHPDATILGHRDLPDVRKACPSFDVREWWDTMRSGKAWDCATDIDPYLTM